MPNLLLIASISVIQLQLQIWPGTTYSKVSLNPSPRLNNTNASLIDMNIAVPGSDLKKIQTSSISVPGEPGTFVAGLSVFHELHCLVRDL
jgi:hypothetical protein